MNKSAPELLKEATKILEDRGKIRDSEGGERSMADCIDSFNNITKNTLSETDGWLFMILLKLARSKQGGFHEDDFLDIIGYSALMAESAIGENHDNT